MIRRRRRLVWVGVLALLGGPLPAAGSESVQQEQPAPDSAEGLQGPLAAAFEERIRKKTFFPVLKDYLEDQQPFLRDTELRLHLRTYVFNRRDDDDSRKAAWAGGGWLAYRSGWWKERLSLGATLYTSQRLWGPDDKDGTLLLRPVQRSYTSLGQAHLKLRHEKNELTLYRQELNLPYVNRQDNRMTPEVRGHVYCSDPSGDP